MTYFIFKNIDSSDYLRVNKLPSIFKPTKDIQKIEVEGRDGFLTQDLGSYKSIIKSVECTIRNLDNIDFICSWLTGSGDVIFSNEPDRKYKAVIINQIEFSRVLRDFKSFIIQFECQPYKYSLDDTVITLSKAGKIFNPCNTKSKPIFKIYGTGNIDLFVNSNVIHLTNVVDYIVIDSELMDCYKDTQLCNNQMNGDFPELSSGNNTISWTGSVTKIEVKTNWRWL